MHSFTTWVTGAKKVRTQTTKNEKAISPQTFWLRGSIWTILIRCDLDTTTLRSFVLLGSVHSIASIFIGQYILNTFTWEIITELSELWLANKCSKRALSLAFYFTRQVWSNKSDDSQLKKYHTNRINIKNLSGHLETNPAQNVTTKGLDLHDIAGNSVLLSTVKGLKIERKRFQSSFARVIIVLWFIVIYVPGNGTVEQLGIHSWHTWC